MMQSKYITACYCRLSRDDENDGTSVSIETQKKLLEDYCKTNGYCIYDFYCDDGYTGTNFDRPEYKRMMADIENGSINMIVAKDLSRLGRNYIEVGRLIEDVFPEKRVRFIAIGDDVDTSRENLDLDLILPMKNIFNQYYPADCSRKTRQAFKTKAMRGEFIGSQAPYGYRKSSEDKHILEIDDRTAPTIQKIFEMAAYEGYGYNKIAHLLTKQKIITPSAYQAELSGKGYDKDPYEWNLHTIKKMMENETYLGHTVNGRKKKLSFKSKRMINMPKENWIIIEDTHIPIISKQLWDDAHKKLSSRKRENKLGEVNLFAGLLKCDKCGYALTRNNARGREEYFCCSTYKKKGKDNCSIHYVLQKHLQEILLSNLKSLSYMINANEEAFVQGILSRLNSGGGKEEGMLREAKEIQNRINELDKRFDVLYEDRLSGLLSDKKFSELSVKCENEQERLTVRLSELHEKLNLYNNAELNVLQFVDEVKRCSVIDSLDKPILNTLIDKIVVSDKEIINDTKTQKVRIFYKFIGELT